MSARNIASQRGKGIETVVSGEEDPSPFSSFFHDGIIPTLTPFRAQIELPNCSPSGSSSRLLFTRACVCLQKKSNCNSMAWQGKAALLQKDASLCYVHCISRFFLCLLKPWVCRLHGIHSLLSAHHMWASIKLFACRRRIEEDRPCSHARR